MPIANIQGRVKRGTLCWADRWVSNVLVVVSGRIPTDGNSALFIGTDWEPDREEGEVRLSFRMLQESAGTRIRFGTRDGDSSMPVTGDKHQMLQIYGREPSPGSDADVMLDIHVDNELKQSLPLSVGTVGIQVHVRAENGNDAAPTQVPQGVRVRFMAMAEPEAVGTFRWVSGSQDLDIISGEQEPQVEVVARGEAGSELLLLVEFTPQDGQPAVIGQHQFSVPISEGVISRWTKALAPVGESEVRSGELLEIHTTVDNNAFRLDEATPIRIAIIQAGEQEQEVLNLLGIGAVSLSQTIPRAERLISLRTLNGGQELAAAVAAFRADYPADFYKRILILEQSGEQAHQRSYQLIAWWQAQVAEGETETCYKAVVTLADHLQGVTAAQIRVVQTQVQPAETPGWVRLRIQGRLIDANPFAAGLTNAEPLQGVQVSIGGQHTNTSLLGIAHFSSVTGLIVKLRDAANEASVDTVSKYLRSRFSQALSVWLDEHDLDQPPSRFLQLALVNELNAIIAGPSIYEESRFQGIARSAEIDALIARGAGQDDFSRLNRLLLERVYNVEIATVPLGEFILDGSFTSANQEITFQRNGVETLTLQMQFGGTFDQTLDLQINNPNSGVRHADFNGAVPEDPEQAIELAIGDITLVVHKLRGQVWWPDSRVIGDNNYLGTPLAEKRIYVLQLDDDLSTVDAQRPANLSSWSKWKKRTRVLRSGRPGNHPGGERTNFNGTFEVKYLDLSLNRAHFIWVESPDPDDPAGDEFPELISRRLYLELRTLNNSHAHQVDDINYQVIDHTYNLLNNPADPHLTGDPISWGMESIKLLNRPLAGDEQEVWAVRPNRSQQASYDTMTRVVDPTHVERINFDDNIKLIDGFNLHSLPIIPIHEEVDQQMGFTLQVITGLQEGLDTLFPRGSLSDDIRLVLDARRIAASIDLSANPGTTSNPQNIAWDGNWSAANPDPSRQRRQCELLEKTYIVQPNIGITGANLANADDARWDFDVITLADFANISIPAPPPRNQAVAANRTLDSEWIPVLHASEPRLLGLALGQHLYLAPGHGFYDSNTPSTDADAQLNRWVSPRGGWNLDAGEDHNNGYIAIEVSRIVRANAMKVTCVREDRDMTRPGVVHPLNNVFNNAVNINFLRLWQQNPISYLGAEWTAPVNTSGDAGVAVALNSTYVNHPNYGQLAGNHNSLGIGIHPDFAAELANSTSPIDIYLAIHTNAGGGAGQGVSCFYLDVTISNTNANEFNTFGLAFAQRVRTEVLGHCHLHPRRADANTYGDFPQGVGEVRDTVDYFYQVNAATPNDSRLWIRHRQNPGGWNHTVFPRTIPMALVEVGFHDNVNDAALLSRAWFRRLAGEALAFAVEKQLHDTPAPAAADQINAAGNTTAPADPADLTQAQTVTLLKAAFGSTQRITNLASNNVTITAEQVRTYMQNATDEVITAPVNVRLGTIVTLIESTEVAYTRLDFVTALRDSLAHLAGHNTPANIEEYVTRILLNNNTLTDLARANRPITRGEAGAFIAAAFGWTPQSLSTVSRMPLDGTPLLSLLDGEEDASKTLPRIEANDINARIRALNPTLLYRITGVILEDEFGQALAFDEVNQSYAVRPNKRIRIVAHTKGIPWNANDDAVQIRLLHGANVIHTSPANTRTREKISSALWVAQFAIVSAAPREYILDIRVDHATRDNRVINASQTVKIYTLL